MIQSNPRYGFLYQATDATSAKLSINDDDGSSSTSSSITSTTMTELSKKKGRKKNLTPEKPLPSDFEPSDYTVIIGRGKKIRETTGNCRLRVIASTFLPQYSQNQRNKPMKTILVNKVIDIIKLACAESKCDSDQRIAFVRQTKEGQWFEVDDSVAREKVGYVFRDLLADRYESSSKSKIAKKMEKRRLLDRQNRQQRRHHQQLHQQLHRQLHQREFQNHPTLLERRSTSPFLMPHAIFAPIKQEEQNTDWQWENKSKYSRDSPPPQHDTVDTFEDALLNSPLIEYNVVEDERGTTTRM